jgi:1-acyl-sn-glycerol-3-phosphate acyltransferase
MNKDKTSLLRNTFRVIISIWFWIEVFGIAALMYPIALILYIFTIGFDKKMAIMHRFTSLWAWISLSLNPLWKIKVTGRDKINPHATYVMVSNHQSGADVIVLFLLWTHFKWIAKKTLFLYPFIGWTMYLNGYLALERGRQGSMKKMMREAGRLIREGNSIMMFPEGTRSKDGRIQPFKTGAFHLALNNQVPVLPIAIRGTSHAIRKGGLLINPNHEIRAEVLDPIPYAMIKDLDPKAVAAMVHEKIAKALEKKTL